MSRLDYCKNELIRHNCYDWKCNHCDGCNIFKAYYEGARRAKESIVRCKDCKHGKEDYPQRIREQMDERWKNTPQTYSCKHSTYSHDGEFFCGYGERGEP